MPSKISVEHLSTSFPENSKQSSKPPPKWRIQVQENQLISQVSKILLQRQTKYWEPLLKSTLKFSKLTPRLFLQILQKTQTSPQISLEFFNWAKKNLHFLPDLKSHCKLTHLLFGSGLSRCAKPILASIIQEYPSAEIVSSFSKVANFVTYSAILCSVLKGYCNRGMYWEALKIYVKAKESGDGVVSVHVYNSLLHLLQVKNETRLAWCVYSSMIRYGVSENQFTWPIIGRILYKDAKFERIGRILDMGINSSSLYDIIIQNYSERGNLDAACGYLAKMYDKKLDPSFSIYSSILDGACKCGDTEVIEMVTGIMIEKGYVPEGVTSRYDSVIQKLSDLGKTYAAKLFFSRAYVEKVELQDATFGCVLKALSNNGRMQDATEIYLIVSEKKMVVDDSCYNSFVNGLCEQKPSDEVYELIKELMEKGFHPHVAELSKHVKAQCENLKFKQAEHLLNSILDKGLVLDSFCCCSLVKHYCSSGKIDSAVKLHNKMKMLRGTFDVDTYNVLLNMLFKQNMIEEALDMFEDMRLHRVYSTESFGIMISELCNVQELRKAMKLHDEMLKLGLKPNSRTYKRLISGFG